MANFVKKTVLKTEKKTCRKSVFISGIFHKYDAIFEKKPNEIFI